MNKSMRNRTQNYIFGFHAAKAFLQNSPENIIKIYVQKNKNDHRIEQFLRILKDYRQDLIPEILDKNSLDKIAAGENHQGIIFAVINSNSEKNKIYDLNFLKELIAKKNAKDTNLLLLILDGVQDPHNLGACLRTAAAANADAVIIPQDNAVGLTPVVRKVASGAAEIVPLVTVSNLSQAMRILKDANIWIYGTDETAATNIYATKFSGSLALVMGAEENGMRHLTAENCDFLLKIPTSKNMPSLNVSVATGVCLFEIVRQLSKNLKN